MSRVLVIGDLHAPFTHPRYLAHCKKIYKKWKCNKVVLVGDEVDNHAISYHETDPDGLSDGDEIDAAIKCLKPWYRAFPEAKVCIGNHQSLHKRKAKTHGLSARRLRSHNEVYEAPDGWNWSEKHIIDDVLYIHGTGKSGQNAHLNWAIGNRMNTVIGHCHAFASISYTASTKDCLFGVNVGWGGDEEAYAMEYGKHFASRGIVCCGVILNGKTPILERMDMK